MKIKNITLILALAGSISAYGMQLPSNMLDNTEFDKLADELIAELPSQVEFDQAEIDAAIEAAKGVDAGSILKDIAEDKKRTAKEMLAEGLKRFKDQQQVLWATDPIKYTYTVDESNYEWVDCPEYEVSCMWSSSKQKFVYKVALEIHQPDGRIINKTGESDEDPRIRDYSYLYPTRYRKKVCKVPNIVIKQAELPIRFGVYKRDIADAALLAGNVAAEYCFNKYITSLRVNRIADHIIAHAEDTACFLRLVKEQLETAEKDHLAALEGKWFFERNKLRAAYLLELPKIKEIFKTYTERITGTSLSPFNRSFFMNMENLPVIVGRLLLNRATDYLERSYVIPDYQHAVTQGGIAYKRDENGDLIKDATPPISMVMLAKAIIHPKLFCQSLQRNVEAGGKGFIKAFMGDVELPSIDNLKLLSKMAGLSLPEWLLSDRAKSLAGLAADICLEGLSMKFFNDYCAQQWVEYLGANHQELLGLIEKYQKAKEQNPKNELELKNAEAEIRKFVQTAHDPSWFFPAKYWYMRFLTDYTTKSKVKNMIMGSAVTIVAWKAWSWWRSSGTTK